MKVFRVRLLIKTFLIALTIIFGFGLYFSFEITTEFIKYAIIYLLIFPTTSCFYLSLCLHIDENKIIRKTFFLKKKEIEIPYRNVTKICRTSWGLNSIYSIVFEIDGKKLYINLNVFNNWKEILCIVSKKINSSLIENDVKNILEKWENKYKNSNI